VLAVLAVRSTPRSQPLAGQSRAFADGRLGARGASRRWCQSDARPTGALRRSGAGSRRGAALRAWWRAGAPPEEPGATRCTRGGRVSAVSEPVRALTLPMQVLAAVDGWMAAACRCAAHTVPEPRREFGEDER
jgi:hypothetical protein